MWDPNTIGVMPKKRKIYQRLLSLSLYTCTEERPCEDTAKTQLTISQEESPHKKANLLALCPWTSSLQNYEKTNVCCLKHPVCDIMSWKTKQINTDFSTMKWDTTLIKI